MEFTPKLTYKGRPLVRSKNEIYYGNLTEGSVVKSYTVNGASSLTDYGDYDEIVNLTDDRVPTSAAGGKVLCTVWLDGGGAPLYAEFTQDSRVVLTARLLSFTSE